MLQTLKAIKLKYPASYPGRAPGFILFAAILLLALGLTGYIAVALMKEDNQQNQHQQSVQLIAQSIEHNIWERRKVLHALTQDSDIIALLTGVSSAQSLRTRLVIKVAEEVANADKILVFNGSGKIVATSETRKAALTKLTPQTTPFIRDSLQGGFMIYPALDPSDNIPGVFLSLPVYLDADEPPIGALALKLGIAEVESLLMVRDEITALISPEGVIFSTNRPIWMYSITRPLSIKDAQRLKNTRQFGSDPPVPLQIDFNRDELDLEGERYRLARTPLAISGWTLVSCQSKDHISPLPILWEYLIGITLFVMGCLAVLVFFLTTTVYRHKQTERMLRQSEDKYHSIFSNVAMGIYQTTLEGRIIEVNPYLAKMLGYRSPNQMMSMISDIEDQIYQDPDDRKEYLKVLRETGQAQGYETRYKKKDGSVIWVSLWGRLVRPEKGSEPFLEGFVMDITDKILAEQEARLRERQLRHADRMISMGILTSGIAHEINNPNTFIMSNAQVVSDAWIEARAILDEYYGDNGDFIIGGMRYSKLRDKMPQMVSRILQGSRRIKRIVGEMRQYSQKGGEGEGIRQQVNLNEVIKSAEILLASMIKKCTHHFEKHTDPELPAVVGSFQRLEQVVINILQNACQALSGPDQSIQLSTSFDRENSQVVMICRDQGAGIAAEHLEHVMDPFFTTKRNSGGTGLGLSISLSIVREYGGSLDIRSSAGGGASVYLRLPAAEIEKPETQAGAPQEARREAAND